MSRITAHCLVKNEENFIDFTIKSVINFVDSIMIFDTGSTDKTVELIKKLMEEYPNKITFEEKGECDMTRHTHLRQEMLEKTKTDWFMILDGDEVWPKRAMEEAIEIMETKPAIESIVAPFYLCVGDIFHRTFRKGKMLMLGVKDYFYPRFLKIKPGLHWKGDYNQDTLLTEKDDLFCTEKNSMILKSKYWHMTHLKRSSADDKDYSSGGNRKTKRRLTYFIIGKKINESIPEVFGSGSDFRMGVLTSFVNFATMILKRALGSP